MPHSIAQALQSIGYTVSPCSAASTFKDRSITETLAKSKSAVGDLLLSFPDYLVILPDMKQGIFFLKIVADSLNLIGAEGECYSRYYPDDVLLVRDGASFEVEARWVRNKETTTARACIEQRF